jgi:DnaJ family protein B protein 4
MSDFYEILGVTKESTSQEIKKAYRALSLEFHPDRNPSPDAKSKFQEISEAYETLSDTEKKSQYDNQQSGFGGMHFSNMNNNPSDMGNIFNMLFGLHGGIGQGMNIHHGINIPHGMPNIRIFHGGQMFQQMQKPPPILKNIQITLEQCYNGCSVPLEIDRWIYNNDIKCNELETIYLTIPPGINENECIMMIGKGNSFNDEIKGDIRVSIQITNNTDFIRHNNDLYYKKSVLLKDALCGFTFEIQHLNGKTFCLNNNTNHTIIKPNLKKTIPNLGMNREDVRGNLIIEFDVIFPDVLSEEQIDSLKNILI